MLGYGWYGVKLIAAHIDTFKVPLLEWMWTEVVYAGILIPNRWEEQ